MALLDFFRKKPVHQEVEIAPNTSLHVYGANKSEADRALDLYAGKEQADAWRRDRSFRAERYDGEKRGLEFGYHGTTINDQRVPLPEIPPTIRVNSAHSQAIDSSGNGPVRATQQGQNIVININLAELGMPQNMGMQDKQREDFSRTMQEVLKRVSFLEQQLAERERQIEQLRKEMQPQKTSLGKAADAVEKIAVPAVSTAAAVAAYENFKPESKVEAKIETKELKLEGQVRAVQGASAKYDLYVESPNAVVTDRMTKHLAIMAKELEASSSQTQRVFARELSEHVTELRGIAKLQEKEPRKLVLPLVLPDQESTERLLKALRNTETELEKKAFGKSIVSEDNRKLISAEIGREVAGLTNVKQIQASMEKEGKSAPKIELEKSREYEGKAGKVVLEKGADDSAFVKAALGYVPPEAKVSKTADAITVEHSGEKHTMKPVEKEVSPRGTLADSIRAAKEVHGGEIAFVSSDWSSQSKIRIQTPERLENASKAVKTLHENGGLNSQAYALTNHGTIRNILTGKDEFIVLTPKAAGDQQLPEQLRQAMEKHFTPVEAKPAKKEKEMALPSKASVPAPGMGV